MAITECLAHISKDLFRRATPSMRCWMAISKGCCDNNFGRNGTRWDRVQWGTSYLVTSSYTRAASTHIHRGSWVGPYGKFRRNGIGWNTVHRGSWVQNGLSIHLLLPLL